MRKSKTTIVERVSIPLPTFAGEAKNQTLPSSPDLVRYLKYADLALGRKPKAKAAKQSK